MQAPVIKRKELAKPKYGVVKRLNLNEESWGISDDSEEETTSDAKVTSRAPITDSFFLTRDGEEIEDKIEIKEAELNPAHFFDEAPAFERRFERRDREQGRPPKGKFQSSRTGYGNANLMPVGTRGPIHQASSSYSRPANHHQAQESKNFHKAFVIDLLKLYFTSFRKLQAKRNRGKTSSIMGSQEKAANHVGQFGYR